MVTHPAETLFLDSWGQHSTLCSERNGSEGVGLRLWVFGPLFPCPKSGRDSTPTQIWHDWTRTTVACESIGTYGVLSKVHVHCVVIKGHIAAGSRLIWNTQKTGRLERKWLIKWQYSLWFPADIWAFRKPQSRGGCWPVNVISFLRFACAHVFRFITIYTCATIYIYMYMYMYMYMWIDRPRVYIPLLYNLL